MSLVEDYSNEVEEIFKQQWSVREGKKGKAKKFQNQKTWR